MRWCIADIAAMTTAFDAQTPQAQFVPQRSIARWRKVAITMLLAGALLCETALRLPQAALDPSWVAQASAAVFVVLAAVVARSRMHQFRAATLLATGVTICVISAIVAATPGLDSVQLFYLWPLLGAAYLLTRAQVVALGAMTGVLYAVGLAARPGEFAAIDYLVFVVSTAFAVSAVRLLSESVQRLVGVLRESSATDALTGLLNRRSFDRRFAELVAQARTRGMPLALMLLDLDHFKRVNDEHGHPVGDRALRRFGELLRDASRAGDVVARVGGEEFAVVLPGAEVGQAHARAEHFLHALREDREVEGLALTASIGVGTWTQDLASCDALLASVDAAVYRAKREGRDRVVVVGAPEPITIRAAVGAGQTT